MIQSKASQDKTDTSQDKQDSDLRMIQAAGWQQGGGRSVGGIVLNNLKLDMEDSFFPRPVSRTATLLTTVSPPSWLITKQLAVSARVVSWMLTILDCSKCLTKIVRLLTFWWWEDCAQRPPRSYWGTRRTVLSRSTIRNSPLSRPQTCW